MIAKARNGIVLDSKLVSKCLCMNYYNSVCKLVIDISCAECKLKVSCRKGVLK